MAPRKGVEPLTFPLGGGRSIQLSYRGRVLKPVQDLAKWMHRGVKRGLNILQYAVLFRHLLPCAASIDQDPEQVLRYLTYYFEN